MSNVITCPSEQDLQQLLLGQMEDARAEPLEEHLEQCDRCLQTASMLKAEDTLAEAVRTQSSAPEIATSEIVVGLMQRLEKLRPEMVPASQTSATISADAASADGSRGTQVTYDFLVPAQAPGELGRLGHYRILGVLGAGGMGVVFQAEDPHLGRLVALKAMLPALASNPLGRQRFLREARAVAAIEHDHIVTIHQVGEENGVPYLAMPLLKGESLDDRLKREATLPMAQVLQLGRETAEGLAAAHGLGLIHRDIKPANLWLEAKEGAAMTESTASDSSFKRVKILDFGLARAAGDATQITHPGTIVGTPAYMAPEQTRAGGVVDQRVDLFSLGCVLYRAATGELPFKGGDTMAVLTALALDTPASPHELNAQIPVPLSELIMELLAKKPTDRPARAQDVVARILAIEQAIATTGKVHGQRSGMKNTALLPRPSLPRERRWWPLGAAVLLGALALASLQFEPVVFRFVTNQGQLVIETSDNDVKVIVKQGDDKVTILDGKTGRQVTLHAGTYQVELGQGKEGLRLSTNQFTLERGGRQIVKVTFEGQPGATRQAAEERVVRKFGPSDKTVTQDGVTVEKDGWRIDADLPRSVGLFHIANPGVEDCMIFYRASMKSADFKGRAYLEMWCRFPAIGEAFSKGFEHSMKGTTDWTSYQTPFFLKKGERPDLIRLNVVIEGKGTVWVKNVELLQVPLPSSTQAKGNDERQTTGQSRPQWKTMVEPRAAERRAALPPTGEIRTLKGHSGEVTSVRFAPGGKRAFSCSKDGTVRCWDIPTGREVWQSEAGEALALDVSHDGSRVLVGTRGLHDFAGAFLLDATTGRTIHRLPMGESWCMSVAFSLDSQHALVVGQGSTFVLWDVATGKELRRFVSPGKRVTAVALSPDGPWAASGSDQELIVRLWNVRTGAQASVFEEHREGTSVDRGGISSLAFSPHGRLLLSAGRTMRCWDVSTGKVLWSHEGLGPINCIAFSPDGRLVFSAGSDNPVRLWDVATGKQIRMLGRSGVLSIAISPDGRLVLLGGQDHSVLLWQLPAPERAVANP